MARPSYNVLTFDLTVARDRSRIVDIGVPYDAVTVLALPAGSIASLSFAENADNIPIEDAQTYQVSGEKDGCPVPADNGLYLTNPAGAGLLTLLVSFGAVLARSA